jgi:death-on-curing protein
MTAHIRLIKEYGGGIGVRDIGLIESALHRPLASFERHLQYQTPFQRAGVLWSGLIRNHGFVDANKRTATAAMARWLLAEGYRLRSGQAELVEMAVAIANKQYELDQIAAWIREHVTPS